MGEKWRIREDLDKVLIVIDNVLKAAKNVASFIRSREVLDYEGYPISLRRSLSTQVNLCCFPPSPSSSLLSQLRRLQSVIKETSNKAAQTSTCILILTFSLVLLVFPSYNLIQLETPVNKHGYKPTGVISRTILTELESSQISEIPDNFLPDASGSVHLQEGAVPFASNLTTDSQEQGNPLALVGQMSQRVSHLEDSQLQKSAGNSSFGRQEDSSDSGAAIPSSGPLQQEPRTDMPPASSWESGNALSVKPGHADEM
ncbi:uncharacterized protein LOC125487866 [Rhincodon typus]|uniref:uncharacterized protein LOC125487866 n=1 Tax=Rhincodon typus TaxID=259920 RepID=UPI002030D19B|nr:uncharacterized protein LOC125487866 [Rhincodon typus]